MNERCCRSAALDGTLLSLAALLALSLGSTARASDSCTIDLRYIGDHSIPSAQRVDGDQFGGISGIDYDPSANLWYLASDDRTGPAPPRFFTASIDFDARHVESVQLKASVHIPAAALDAESIRVDTKNRSLLLAGEGDAAKGVRPWLRQLSFSGAPLHEIQLPPLIESALPNRSIEGLSFDPRRRSLWLGMEAPLSQDGPPADERRGADVRLMKLDLKGRLRAQYMYRTDVASAPSRGEVSDIGVSEILALGEQELLVLERSGVGVLGSGFRFRARLYCVDLRQATDVNGFESLAQKSYRLADKQQVLDFEPLSSNDNIEGVAWGPVLEDGSPSLVFVSDNNFFPEVPTRLLFFSVRRPGSLETRAH